MVELARFAWGYSKREAPMAAAALLLQFGHAIPTRPAAWHRKRVRQQPARDALDEVRIQSLHRRLFRAYCGAWLSTIQDPREREIEAEAMREALAPVARRLYFEGGAQR